MRKKVLLLLTLCGIFFPFAHDSVFARSMTMSEGQVMARYPVQKSRLQYPYYFTLQCKKTKKKCASQKAVYRDSLKLVKKAFGKIDDLFNGVPHWLATVYDPKNGGFYDNYSMKISPKFAPDIQSTLFGYKTLLVDGAIYNDLNAVPEMIKNKLIAFMQSRQDSATGYFFDPPYKKEIENSERIKGRILSMAVDVLHGLNTKPLYPLPGARKEKDRPSYLQSAKKYKAWMDGQDWSRVWTAFDHILSQSAAIRSLPEALRDSIVSVTYSYAKKHQRKDGLWGEKQNMAVSIGGANKIGGFLNDIGKSLPHPDQIYDTLINWFQSSPRLSAPKVSNCTICVPRNTIRIFYYIEPHLSHPISYKDKLTIIKRSYRFMNYYKMSDGGFPKSNKEFIFAPDDINLGRAKVEQSDMNGTHLMINMRSSLYKLCGVLNPGLPNKKDFMNYLPNYKFSK